MSTNDPGRKSVPATECQGDLEIIYSENQSSRVFMHGIRPCSLSSSYYSCDIPLLTMIKLYIHISYQNQVALALCPLVIVLVTYR
jgi:hypothetical protein